MRSVKVFSEATLVTSEHTELEWKPVIIVAEGLPEKRQKKIPF